LNLVLNSNFVNILDIGRVFPNSQIVHQMPYGHVVTAAGQPPPASAIQLQHQDLNGQTLAPGKLSMRLRFREFCFVKTNTKIGLCENISVI